MKIKDCVIDAFSHFEEVLKCIEKVHDESYICDEKLRASPVWENVKLNEYDHDKAIKIVNSSTPEYRFWISVQKSYNRGLVIFTSDVPQYDRYHFKMNGDMEIIFDGYKTTESTIIKIPQTPDEAFNLSMSFNFQFDYNDVEQINKELEKYRIPITQHKISLEIVLI